MFSLYPALLAAAWLASVGGVQAQNPNYTVHSTVIFARTGEHSPLLEDPPYVLTSYGMKQMQNLGAFFRRRYMGSSSGNTNGPFTIMPGLSTWELQTQQTIVQTSDYPYMATAAQALVQGFYPPFPLIQSGNNTDTAPRSTLANGTYIPNPLGGYQYPLVETFSEFDFNSIFLNGEVNCRWNGIMQTLYYSTPQVAQINTDTQVIYGAMGRLFLQGVLPQSSWGYQNAYVISNYLNFAYNHNKSAREILDNAAYSSMLTQIRDLASLKQFSLHGDKTVSGMKPGDKILTIAGQTLAAKVLYQMMDNIRYKGTVGKVNFMVGDYSPMIALFSLMGLPEFNTNFYNLPSQGSALVFELFTWENATRAYTLEGSNYPSTDNLRVRFYFRNTTGDGSMDADDGLRAYPLFGRSPSTMDMSWTEFYNLMSSIQINKVANWCSTCQSRALFCAAYNTSLFAGPDNKVRERDADMTPQVAGVIGAGVTIGVLLVLLLAGMFLTGIRFHRDPGAGLAFGGRHGRKSSLGGFKGSAKLASDADLHIGKNAAPVGVSVVPTSGDPFADESGVTSPSAAAAAAAKSRGHERVGSWELKEKDAGRFSSLTGSTVNSSPRVSRRSFEDDERNADEEIDRIASNEPVKAQERI